MREATFEELKTLEGIIYLFLNTLNNKIYVGQTINTFHARYTENCDNWAKYASNNHFKKALKKYFAQNFKIYIMDSYQTIEKLNYLEELYIKLFASNHSNYGYNKEFGGTNIKISQRASEERRMSEQEFIKICNEKHKDKFDYSLINNSYNGLNSRLIIICKKHGPFEQNASNHRRGWNGCLSCKGDITQKQFLRSFSDIMREANIFHNNKYKYDESTYKNTSTKMRIICPKHGDFWQKFNAHMHCGGCYKCGKERCGEKLRKTTKHE